MVRAYDRRFVNALNLKAMGPEVNTEIVYKAQLLRALIIEIPGHLDWTAMHGVPRRSTMRLAESTIRSLLSDAGITHLVWDHPVSDPTRESSPAAQPLIDRLGRLYPERPDVVDPPSPPSDGHSSG